MADGIAKINDCVKSAVDQAVINLTQVINTTNAAQSQEIMLLLHELRTEVNVLMMVKNNTKKPINKEKKTEDGENNTTATTPAKQVKEVKFPNNKRTYFLNRWKESAEFRESYMTPELSAVFKNTPSVINAKPASLLNQEASTAYTHYKNDPKFMETIERLFVDEKAKFDASIKPPQETLEANTP